MPGICFAIDNTFDVGVSCCSSLQGIGIAIAAATSDIASTSWIGVAAPMLALRNEVGGRNLKVFARAVVITHSGVLAGEAQMVSLEAGFSELLALGAQSVGVAAAVLS